MKYLRRINEKNTYRDLHEYISLCFIDFIDKDKSTLEDFEDDYEGDYDDITVSINMPFVYFKDGKWNFNKPSNIEDMIKYSEELVELYKDVEQCIKKVKTNYDVDINMYYEYERVDSIPFDAYLQIVFKLKYN